MATPRSVGDPLIHYRKDLQGSMVESRTAALFATTLATVIEFSTLLYSASTAQTATAHLAEVGLIVMLIAAAIQSIGETIMGMFGRGFRSFWVNRLQFGIVVRLICRVWSVQKTHSLLPPLSPHLILNMRVEIFW